MNQVRYILEMNKDIMIHFTKAHIHPKDSRDIEHINSLMKY